MIKRQVPVADFPLTLTADQTTIRQLQQGNTMGADRFILGQAGILGGESASFNEAVEQAQYAHGHAGYTGTIAEKDSFVMIVEAKDGLPRSAAIALAEKLTDEDDPRVDDKWGPAGCIPVKGFNGDIVGFVFFGWASS